MTYLYLVLKLKVHYLLCHKIIQLLDLNQFPKNNFKNNKIKAKNNWNLLA